MRELGPKDRGSQDAESRNLGPVFNISVQARVEGGKSDIDKITAILVQGVNSIDILDFAQFLGPLLVIFFELPILAF